MSETNRKDLSVGTIMVLHALSRGHRYGFDLIEQTGLTGGTIYPTLDRLRKEGLVTSDWEDAAIAHEERRPQRKYFQISDLGKAALIRGLERYRALAPITIDGVAYPHRSDGRTA